MSIRNHKALLFVLVAMLSLPVLAQPGPGDGGGPGGQGGPGGGGGPPDPQQMRQMMADRMKQTLGASDEEMKVLQPAIDKVRQLQRDVNGGGGRGGPGGGGPGGGGPGGGPNGFGGPGGGQDRGGPGGGGQDRAGQDRGGPQGGPGANQPQSEVQQKLADLRELLQSDNPSDDQIKTKLAALRTAREKAKTDLEKAQKDLRDLLTSKQEAVMVMMNVLP